MGAHLMRQLEHTRTKTCHLSNDVTNFDSFVDYMSTIRMIPHLAAGAAGPTLYPIHTLKHNPTVTAYRSLRLSDVTDLV